MPFFDVDWECIISQFWQRFESSTMYIKQEDHRGSDRMVVVFTTTYAIGAYHYYKGVSSNPAQGLCRETSRFVNPQGVVFPLRLIVYWYTSRKIIVDLKTGFLRICCICNTFVGKGDPEVSYPLSYVWYHWNSESVCNKSHLFFNLFNLFWQTDKNLCFYAEVNFGDFVRNDNKIFISWVC
jgi:hypothetical protein